MNWIDALEKRRPDQELPHHSGRPSIKFYGLGGFALFEISMRRLLPAATLCLLPAFLLSPAKAIDIIGNFPSNDGVASDLDITQSKAMGFTMPSGGAYKFDSATVSLYVDTQGAETVWSFGLFADSSGNPAASPLTTLVLPTLNMGDANYVLTPSAPITLQPNTTYWLVANSASAASYGGWNRNDPSKTPSGLATSAGARAGNPPTSVSDFYNSYSIQGTPVPAAPGPLPVFGAYAAFGVSRHLRSRLRAQPKQPR